ncbi:MAG: hypothetical protein JWM47_1740 [Acidimicrobiales bacterium]|nr:hypothetical protein [Acidimicrobiales bacterium]
MATVAERVRAQPWWLVLLGAVMASAGAALFYAALTPRAFAADEPAHTAYAEEVAHGRLPTIDTVQPDRAAALAPGERPGSLDHIYVANHPPLFAAVQGGIARVIQGLGIADDPTLAVGRFLNALCVLASVVATARLGREVSGSLRVGVLGAALFAATPALWSLSTFGYSDGGGILATTLVVWAGAAAWTRRTHRSLLWLGLAVAAAGATRATALIVAVAVAVTVLARVLADGRDRHDGRDRSLAGSLRLVATALGPAVVLTAWWYVRSWVLFGDPTGAVVLNDRLDRPDRTGGMLGRFGDLAMWQTMISELAASSYTATLVDYQVRLPAPAVWAMALTALVAVAGLALPPWARPHGSDASLRAWPVLAVALGAVALGIAGHTAQGGAPHPRYLLLAVPVLTTLVVVGLDRIHRVLSMAAVAGAIAASVAVGVLSTRWVDRIMAGHDLHRFGPAALGWIGVAVASAGLVLAGVAAIEQRLVEE